MKEYIFAGAAAVILALFAALAAEWLAVGGSEPEPVDTKPFGWPAEGR